MFENHLGQLVLLSNTSGSFQIREYSLCHRMAISIEFCFWNTEFTNTDINLSCLPPLSSSNLSSTLFSCGSWRNHFNLGFFYCTTSAAVDSVSFKIVVGTSELDVSWINPPLPKRKTILKFKNTSLFPLKEGGRT